MYFFLSLSDPTDPTADRRVFLRLFILNPATDRQKVFAVMSRPSVVVTVNRRHKFDDRRVLQLHSVDCGSGLERITAIIFLFQRPCLARVAAA